MNFLFVHSFFQYIFLIILNLRYWQANNLLDSEMRPIDLLRFKLSFFGASKFDPKSDLWTRITLFQGAPLPDQFANDESDEWPFPTSPV